MYPGDRRRQEAVARKGKNLPRRAQHVTAHVAEHRDGAADEDERASGVAEKSRRRIGQRRVGGLRQRRTERSLGDELDAD